MVPVEVVRVVALNSAVRDGGLVLEVAHEGKILSFAALVVGLQETVLLVWLQVTIDLGYTQQYMSDPPEATRRLHCQVSFEGE